MQPSLLQQFSLRRLCNSLDGVLRIYYIREPQICNFLLMRPANLMTALSNLNTALLWSVGCFIMRYIRGAEFPDTLKNPVSLTKEGLINDFSPKGRDTQEILRKQEMVAVKSKQPRWPMNRLITWKTQKHTLRFPPQLPAEPARQPDAGRALAFHRSSARRGVH